MIIFHYYIIYPSYNLIIKLQFATILSLCAIIIFVDVIFYNECSINYSV